MYWLQWCAVANSVDWLDLPHNDSVNTRHHTRWRMVIHRESLSFHRDVLLAICKAINRTHRAILWRHDTPLTVLVVDVVARVTGRRNHSATSVQFQWTSRRVACTWYSNCNVGKQQIDIRVCDRTMATPCSCNSVVITTSCTFDWQCYARHTVRNIAKHNKSHYYAMEYTLPYVWQHQVIADW